MPCYNINKAFYKYKRKEIINMRRLGISIYPEKSDKETILNYIDKTSKAGFSRIFSCLLSVEKSKERNYK